MMYLNLYSNWRSCKKRFIIASGLVSGDFRKALFSGCSNLVLREFSTAFSRTSFRWNDEDSLSLAATPRMSALFSLVLPCLTCNPFNAKL